MCCPEPKYILRSSLPPMYCVHFWKCSGEDVLLCGCEDGKVYTWDLETARTNKTPAMTAGPSPCYSMCSASDLLVTQDKAGCVKVWSQDHTAWTAIRTISLQYSGFCRVCISQDASSMLLCPRHGGTLEVHGVDTPQKLFTLDSFESESQKLGEVMTCKLIDLSGIPYVLAAYENNEIHLWDLRRKRSVGKYVVPKCPIVIDFDGCSGMGLCGNVSNKIPIFKLERSGEFTTVAEVRLQTPGVSCVQIEPERNFVTIGCWNKQIQLIPWKNAVDRLPVKLTVHKDMVQDICFSPWPVLSWESKCLMAACSKDAQVSLWDFADTMF